MKILFITHDTTRTGAPMVLLHFLRWLKEHQPQVDVDVLALRGGNMEGEFQDNCYNYYSYSLETKKVSLSIIQRILKKLHIYKQKNIKDVFLSNLAKNGYDVIYANTVVTLPVAKKIVEANKESRLVAHIHELNVVIKQILPNIKDYLPYIKKVIVPSNLVAENLMTNFSFSNEVIHKVYECAQNIIVDIIPENKSKLFTVGASGYVHWRKGYDVFVQVARFINKNYPDVKIHFVWVGKMDNETKIIIEEDIKKLGLADKLTFLGEVNNPSTYFNAFDVFLMTSREDPFPLVCIEVGLLGKPIISFEQATGTNEVLLKGGGFIVPYLDIEAMAEAVMLYYNNREKTTLHGDINRSEFGKFTPAHICPQLYHILESGTHES